MGPTSRDRMADSWGPIKAGLTNRFPQAGLSRPLPAEADCRPKGLDRSRRGGDHRPAERMDVIGSVAN